MTAEYTAVRDGGAGLIDLSERGRIRVSGSEATMFLNGLVTNDMKSLSENHWMPAAFPTVQGRLIGVVRVVRVKDGFLIDTERASHDAVLKTTSRFTMAGDFKVSDVSEKTTLLSLQGKSAADIVEKVLSASVSDLPRNGVSELEAATVVRATHTAEDGFDLVVDSTRADELRQQIEDAGARPVDQQTFDLLRIEAGIARFGIDMDESNVIPEINLDEAVSYTKGCYVGQEIIVRIKHRGHPAKKLVGLKADAPIERGAIINSDSNQIGRVTSAAVSPKVGSIGLGYVRYEFLEPGTKVLVDNAINATVAELPFIRGSWYQD
jgi:folate-binding protein YgfZ